MRRGTTPTITVTLDAEAITLDALYLTIAQYGETRIEKNLADGSVDGTAITFPLTQEDTLALDQDAQAEIQVRGRIGAHAFASDVLVVSVDKILKDGEI